MANVYIESTGYAEKQLKPVIHGFLEKLVGDRIKPGDRVLLKPNLLMPATPEQAIQTHPLVVKAAAEYVLDSGASVWVADSPAAGAFDRVLRMGGYNEALAGLPVEIFPLQAVTHVDIGAPYGSIQIAEAAMADMVINLPNLKTHTQMLLTLGVKNMFGCIVGMQKPEWHFRAGVDRDVFAALLVRIYQVVNPAATILDGIRALEGQGPGKRGTPKDVGIVAASGDAISLDMVICRLLGVDPQKVPTCRHAKAHSLNSHPAEAAGDMPAISDFNLPEPGDPHFGPRFLQGFLRRHLFARPVPDMSTCRLCGECAAYCPASAITIDRKQVNFDYNQCIRCYCCIEVCPHGALQAIETPLGKIKRRLAG